MLTHLSALFAEPELGEESCDVPGKQLGYLDCSECPQRGMGVHLTTLYRRGAHSRGGLPSSMNWWKTATAVGATTKSAAVTQVRQSLPAHPHSERVDCQPTQGPHRHDRSRVQVSPDKAPTACRTRARFPSPALEPPSIPQKTVNGLYSGPALGQVR